MDHTDHEHLEQYDPDGDVSRFLGSLNHDQDEQMLLLSPQPLSSQELRSAVPVPVPMVTDDHQDQYDQHIMHSLLPQDVLRQLPPVPPQDLLQQALAPLFMPEVTPPPLLPCHDHPMLPQFPHVQQNQSLIDNRTDAVPCANHMETEVNVAHQPHSIEGVIIAAMESIPLEGSSSSNPRNDATYEPIFHQVAPGQRRCSSRCITLRQLLHSSPNRNVVFAVHGGLGTFDHAVFNVEYFARDGMTSARELFHVELSMRSHNWVKSFILGCISLLRADSTGTVHDSLTSFYDTLCADMNTGTTTVDETLSMDLGSWSCFRDLPDFELGGSSNAAEGIFADNGFGTFNPPVLPEPTAIVPDPTQVQNQNPSLSLQSISLAAPDAGGSSNSIAGSKNCVADRSSSSSSETAGSSSGSAIVIRENPQAELVDQPADAGPRRSQLALQRQRTANMRLPELAQYLHLPIADAAKRLGVCSTALKHVCRKNGLERWPSRQIQAIDRQIAKLERHVTEKHLKSGWLAIKEQIDALLMKRTAIYERLFEERKEPRDRKGKKGT